MGNSKRFYVKDKKTKEHMHFVDEEGEKHFFAARNEAVARSEYPDKKKYDVVELKKPPSK